MPAATITVFTDGACLGNPGPGGWAWAVPAGPFANGPEPHTTNQRMEIRAAYEAARALLPVAGPQGVVEIVSDSTYVVNCFRDRWWEGWMSRGWTNKARKPVANRDLWEPFIDLYRSDPGRLRFRWVKGHSADAMNDLVDRLAVEAARTQRGRSGDEPPEEVGPADVVAARAGAGAGAAAADPRVPEGWKLAVTGERWYEEDLLTPGLRAKLVEIVKAKHELRHDLVVLTGLGLGAEQLGAEAAAEAGVRYVAVLAFPNPETVWPPAAQERYRRLLAGAESVVVLQNNPPESKQKAGAALARRDAWLARHADEAVVVWDGKDEWVGRLIRSFQDHLGEEEVWVLSP